MSPAQGLSAPFSPFRCKETRQQRFGDYLQTTYLRAMTMQKGSQHANQQTGNHCRRRRDRRACLRGALALQRDGQKVTVFEQAETLGEVGAGLSISSNGALGLKSLGVMDEFRRVAYAPDYQLLRHYQNGRIPAQVPRGLHDRR